jgi:hypothetical protein
MFDWVSSEVPILFPAHIGHNEIVRMIQSVYPGVNPISAGFVSHDKTCYGSSTSVDLKSRDIDTAIVALLFKNEYGA